MRRCASAKKCTFIFMCRGGSYQYKKRLERKKNIQERTPTHYFSKN